MGWASGSELAEEVWEAARPHISKKNRQKVANAIIDAFEDRDCDTMDEAEQLMIDADREVYCWDCDEKFPMSQLNEDHLCKNCKEK